jgi:hypothetical protein
MPSPISPRVDPRPAFLSATAGLLFLLVGLFGSGWDWRRILTLVAGVLWLAISVRQLEQGR